MVILITGGAGFIGSNLIHYWLAQNPGDTIVNFDALTYAGNLANLAGVESNPNYHFFKGDLRKQEQLDSVFEQFSIDSVIHLAAESHVDRSINDPSPFIDSNIKGTFQLLETARNHWKEDLKDHRFLHVSTMKFMARWAKRDYLPSRPHLRLIPPTLPRRLPAINLSGHGIILSAWTP